MLSVPARKEVGLFAAGREEEVRTGKGFRLSFRRESYFRLDFSDPDVFLLLVEFIDYLSDKIEITVGGDYALY